MALGTVQVTAPQPFVLDHSTLESRVQPLQERTLNQGEIVTVTCCLLAGLGPRLHSEPVTVLQNTVTAM